MTPCGAGQEGAVRKVVQASRHDPAPKRQVATDAEAGNHSWSTKGATDSLAGLALLIGVFWSISSSNYARLQPGMFALLLVGLASGVYLLTGGRFAAWGTLAYAITIGLANRVGRHAFNGSDVIGTTREAITLIAHGSNPYDHTFRYSNPPGSPFPYLPGEIAFYAIPHAIAHQIVGTDKWAGVGIVLALAGLAVSYGPAPAALGTMLYATFEPAVLRSLDGSNDTSLAFLVTLGIVLLSIGERRGSRPAFFASALFFGWALAFKEFSWIIFPFIIAHIRHRGGDWKAYLATALIPAVTISLPFFVSAPTGFIHNTVAGLTFHNNVFGITIWSALQSLGWSPAVMKFSPVLVVGAVVGLAGFFLKHSADDLGLAVFQGIAVLFVALFLAKYATSSYYMFGVAVICAGGIIYLGNRASGSTSGARAIPSVGAPV